MHSVTSGRPVRAGTVTRCHACAPSNGQVTGWRSAFVRAALAASAALVLGLAGCGDGSVPATDPRIGFVWPEPADFSAETDLVRAFERAHEKLSAEYALTEWKGLDWAAMRDRHLPAVRRAAASGDPQAWLLALHAWIFEIGDGHVSLPKMPSNAAVIDAVVSRQSGGGYGLGLAALDDGRIIAAKVAAGSPAERAGILPGAQIVSWGGVPVEAAVDAVDTGVLVAAFHMATLENRRLEQLRLLSRAPVGSALVLDFLNPAQSQVRSARLQAIDDAKAGLSLLDFASPAPIGGDASVLSWRVLDSGHGYLRLTVLADLENLAQYPDAILERFRQAIAAMNAARVPGLVLDLRGNHGGYDQLAAEICGFFTDKPSVYEITEFYDQRTGGFLRLTGDDRTGEFVDATMTVPQPERFSGPVAVLVNPRTISSGEGVARCVDDLPDGAAVGFHGTHGSFAMVGGQILLPHGLVLQYPFGRSVDAQGVVQIDSRRGVGGVLPAVRVPRTFGNTMAFARGEDVELQAAIAFLAARRRSGPD